MPNSVLSLPISRTIVPHFPYYRSLGLLGNLFQNKGLAHFSVSSLRISKILYGASQPSCCAARLLRAGKVVRPSQDGQFGKTERGLPEIVESPRAFSFRRAFPLSRFFERPNLAGRSIPSGPGAQGLRALSRMAKRWKTASGGFHAAWLGAVIVRCFCF